jgi:acyl dehydratase
MNYLEDIRIGERFEIGRYTFAAADIKSFALRFDPQPFHLDEEAGARSHFGALCASGWHTAVIWSRLMTDFRRRRREAPGVPATQWGPSLGFRELKWLRPVYAGDTLAYVTEALQLRAARSRPGWGLAEFLNTATNHRGERVFSFVSIVFVPMKSG